ncbi:class I SAM-dependent methyltransferase [Ruegeria marina]|uniref:Ubiquinone/menaquinone biosynthesis C-methylase UbiE n=1 Tax=Ruegeria marina TaxID=639004 RepID=A0A1G7CUZ3_9RHOB|nr:class I SAM-dependent methyltransferase [Ruegeria marina]SDE43051.1 Ubiquinone/menaquinone biosynthesis C-methylase UbiE [Ruegeria marina]
MAQTAADAENPDYDAHAIEFLELLWGKGHLSPGGTDEVDRIVSGIDFTGLRVLDIGCGSGGNVLHLARTRPLASIVGFDVEAPVVAVASRRAEKDGLAERVSFVRADPGPLPFAEEAFDLVFSKDSLLHVPDKDALAAELFRILAPGGQVAVGDWMIGHDGPMSADMAAYVAAEDLGFAMGSPERYRSAMEKAGFREVKVVSRNRWYLERAQNELADLKDRRYQEFCAACGKDYIDYQINTWTLMVRVLETGEHCPSHLFARKP